MKYLKKFNEELKSTTYKSAADKLKYKHPVRASHLSDFSAIRLKEEEDEKEKIAKEREYKEWEENIKKYSPFGTFRFNINTNSGPVFEADFYLLVSHWYDDEEISQDSEFWLNLDFQLIPKDIETYERVKSCGRWDWQDGYTFHIWRGWVNIKTREYDCEVSSFSTDTADNFSGRIEISDRKTALKFKRLMVSIFTTKDYPDFVGEQNKPYPSLYNKFEATLAESGISSDFGLEMNHIADCINKISVNSLYQTN